MAEKHEARTPEELAFTDLFAHPPPQPSSDFQEWLLRAIAYPAVESARGAVADPVALAKPLAETERWLKTVVAEPFLPPQPPVWFALRKTPFGPDCLFTGWRVGDRWFQVATRQFELHVRTALGPVEDPTNKDMVMGRVLGQAAVLLRCNSYAPDRYSIATVGPFLAGKANPNVGWKALTFATDGTGVKYSVRKVVDKSQVKTVGAPESPPPTKPWFDPDEPEKRKVKKSGMRAI